MIILSIEGRLRLPSTDAAFGAEQADERCVRMGPASTIR